MDQFPPALPHGVPHLKSTPKLALGATRMARVCSPSSCAGGTRASAPVLCPPFGFLNSIPPRDEASLAALTVSGQT